MAQRQACARTTQFWSTTTMHDHQKSINLTHNISPSNPIISELARETWWWKVSEWFTLKKSILLDPILLSAIRHKNMHHIFCLLMRKWPKIACNNFQVISECVERSRSQRKYHNSLNKTLSFSRKTINTISMFSFPSRSRSHTKWLKQAKTITNFQCTLLLVQTLEHLRIHMHMSAWYVHLSVVDNNSQRHQDKTSFRAGLRIHYTYTYNKWIDAYFDVIH